MSCEPGCTGPISRLKDGHLLLVSQVWLCALLSKGVLTLTLSVLMTYPGCRVVCRRWKVPCVSWHLSAWRNSWNHRKRVPLEGVRGSFSRCSERRLDRSDELQGLRVLFYGRKRLLCRARLVRCDSDVISLQEEIDALRRASNISHHCVRVHRIPHETLESASEWLPHRLVTTKELF